MLGIALAISILFHIVLFALLRFEAATGGAPAAPVARPEPTGMEVVNIVPVPEDQLPEAEEPAQPVREDAAPRVVRTPQGAATVVAPPADSRDPARTVAERIAPRVGDARLFAEPGPEMPEPTDYEALARERLLARIDGYNATEAAAAEAARKATDWTVKGENGEKWGVSPGKIHLGGLTLPLPFGFAPPPGRREEFAERNRRFGEIEDQRNRETGRATVEERVKAMRERADAKRDSARAGRSGGH